MSEKSDSSVDYWFKIVGVVWYGRVIKRFVCLTLWFGCLVVSFSWLGWRRGLRVVGCLDAVAVVGSWVILIWIYIGGVGLIGGWGSTWF